MQAFCLAEERAVTCHRRPRPGLRVDRGSGFEMAVEVTVKVCHHYFGVPVGWE